MLHLRFSAIIPSTSIPVKLCTSLQLTVSHSFGQTTWTTSVGILTTLPMPINYQTCQPAMDSTFQAHRDLFTPALQRRHTTRGQTTRRSFHGLKSRWEQFSMFFRFFCQIISNARRDFLRSMILGTSFSNNFLVHDKTFSTIFDSI